ncbi:MAG TPA: DNA glycosylase [Verrucomicrobiae bacterium]|nr:DNA glycosylase [Verrucomicrobiae bacterium]
MSKPEAALNETFLPVRDYDLAATLTSGQAFRWKRVDDAWEGVVGDHWVALSQRSDGILARLATPTPDWRWLRNYLQVDVNLNAVLLSFPDDEPTREAVLACRGLRLLRQEPWECLASFILSSTKQIVQIQQIVALLCQRFGKPLAVPPGHAAAFGFPTAGRLAACAETDLRGCKMGFRAPNLLATAKLLAAGEFNLESLRTRTTAEARSALMELPGVGRKIADCVLLFAYGFQDAFPVDVWVLKALKQLYFAKRRPTQRKLREFADTHFGANAGYAQQYLFHYMRTAYRAATVRER